MPETLDDLRKTLERADLHTAMLMKQIKFLETKLKAAEYAAKINYDGWQQEIARNWRK